MALFGKLSGPMETIGIDIGSHTIKVMQVVPSRGGYQLVRAGYALTPHEAIKQGVVENKAAIADAVHDLLRTLGVNPTMAVAAVAGPAVVVRQIRMPAMTEAQLRKSIVWEARNYLSFPAEDSLLDFQILDSVVVDGNPQMNVMLVASPRDLVDSRVAALEEAGLEPVAIELEPFALIRGVLDLPVSAIQETVALVEIGATYTHISIVSNGQFVLTRSVTIAGNSFTDAIASALDISATDAETIKETEVQVLDDEAALARLTPRGQQATRVLEPLLAELTREIRRSFAFFTFQQEPGIDTAGGTVNRVVLSGGSARVGNIAAYLEGQLNLPVTIIDVFTSPQLLLAERTEELTRQAPLFATAFGLALREPMIARDKGGAPLININLIAERRVKKLREITVLRTTALCFALALLLIVVLIGVYTIAYREEIGYLASVDKELTKLEAKRADLQATLDQIDARRPVMNLLKQAQVSEGAWLIVLADLSKITESNVVVSDFSTSNADNAVSVHVSGRASDEDTVASFMQAFPEETLWAGTPTLGQVSAVDDTQHNRSFVQFDLTVPVKGMWGGDL